MEKVRRIKGELKFGKGNIYVYIYIYMMMGWGRQDLKTSTLDKVI